jgi:hypothetical protein
MQDPPSMETAAAAEQPSVDMTVRVYGQAKHEGSTIYKRQLSGEKRLEVVQKIMEMGTQSVKKQMTNSLDEKSIKNDNFSNVLSNCVLRNAVSMHRKTQVLAEDYFDELRLAQDLFASSDMYSINIKG